MAEALPGKIDRKSAISLQHVQFDSKFLVEGVLILNLLINWLLTVRYVETIITMVFF